ncbi:MAG: hypothetical protein JSU67_09810 [Gammaproteobacteria bacterium]|nr:MAG: hypothetical protein EP300_03290 [Gammaproteobacteria bacterium]UCH38472.1 MAG: hypothetical protein JSU67_09810 [Gammaproteobacteria bacterium]
MNIEAEAENIQSFVDRGNFHAAYNIALSGLNACRRENDQAGVDRFIEIIRGIVDSLAAEFGSSRRPEDSSAKGQASR